MHGNPLNELGWSDEALTSVFKISWSPDGCKIAFRSDASGNGEINVVDIQTGNIKNLTQHDAYDGEPVWSPVLLYRVPLFRPKPDLCTFYRIFIG